jgi:hypothetical protein
MDPRCRAFTRQGKPFTSSGERCRNRASECVYHSEAERQAAYAYDERARRNAQARNIVLSVGGAVLAVCCVIGLVSKGVSHLSRAFLPASAHTTTITTWTPATTRPWTSQTTTTVTSTVTRTNNTRPNDSADEPHWEGMWLMNYWEDPGDCGQNNWHWVVQPGDSTDMYALREGCFPGNWWSQVLTRCQNAGLPAGTCAVWDPAGIMSEYRRRGNIKVVGLTQACLDRAGLDSFHEGPLHRDCVV